MHVSKKMRFNSLCSTALVLCCFLFWSSAEASNTAQLWFTSLDGKVMLQSQADIPFSPSISLSVSQIPNFEIKVNLKETYQHVHGFGAALTDSSAWLLSQIRNANESAYEEALDMFFDEKNGAGLSILRIPASTCDFSLSDYTYDDTVNDFGLSHFSIEHDKQYMLPILKDIKAKFTASGKKLKTIMSPWSAPAWLKTSNSLFSGSLLEDMYDTYASFLVDALTQYAASGIEIDYLTLQNEPLFEPGSYAGMYVSPQNATLLTSLVISKLAATPLSTRVLAYDHNWDRPDYPTTVFSAIPDSSRLAGVAWHCYGGDVSAQSTVHNMFPDKETHLTECSGGEWAPDFAPDLTWNFDTLYKGGVDNFASSVLHWNLLLDENYGPTNHGCLNCRGVGTVQSTNYAAGLSALNVEFAGMGHFSKFLPGSRADSTVVSNNATCVRSVSFLLDKPFDGDETRNGALTVVLNACDSPQLVRVSDENNLQYVDWRMEPGLASFVWTV